MASIYKELHTEVSPEELWQRVRDVGNISSALFPNVLGQSHLADERTRSCTLPDGSELREQIVTIDDDRRRVVYSIVEGPMLLTHHSASMQVFAEGGGARFVWITDVLPDAVAQGLGEALEAATQDLANTLSAAAAV